MHQNSILEVLSEKDASQNGILEPFFAGTGITNATPLKLNFGSLFAFWHLFKKNSGA
jgi:hypothetical protein